MAGLLQNVVMPTVMLVNRVQMALDAPEKYGVVTVGCELMQWFTTIEEEMLPIPVANHALAGSSVQDVVNGVSYQVVEHEPRVVIFMAGCNDIHRGLSPQAVANGFRQFCAQVHESLEDTQIMFISLICTPLMESAHKSEDIDETNMLCRKICDGDPRLTYMDVNSIFMYSDGTQRKEMFQFFDSHNLTTQAYSEFSLALKHQLQRVWDKAGGETMEHLATRDEEEQAGGEKEL